MHVMFMLHVTFQIISAARMGMGLVQANVDFGCKKMETEAAKAVKMLDVSCQFLIKN